MSNLTAVSMAAPASQVGAFPGRRSNKELLRLSKHYAQDDPRRSWWHLLSTLAGFIALIAFTCTEVHWLWRLPASVLAGLMLVRLFILYHDFQHKTILRGSKIAKAIMTLYGLAALNPPSIWNRSHDHHHHNNAKIFGANIGSVPIMTVESWRRAPAKVRLGYAISRHPITIALGYLTVFLYGMCIRSLVAQPRMHLDSALALVVHGALIALALSDGVDVLILAVMIPSMLAAAMGAYLFYAQHNCPGLVLQTRADWDYVRAALDSSSFIRMSPLMHYFTGNIGYHHVHHLNHRIPFYRLPEAMAAITELQSPQTTSLSPADILRCFRLKLWDRRNNRLVGFAAVGA
jgi:omega-6 fatty acid desaturase (delta-12 desaturase)